MTPFFFHAKPRMHGRIVELVVYKGQHGAPKNELLGAITLSAADWETFRTIIVGGMRVAGYLKIPVEMMDGTRKEPEQPKPGNVH